MKKIIFLVLSTFPWLFSIGQDFELLKTVEFNAKDDYQKYDKEILAGANYILNVAVSDDTNRLIALKAVKNWSAGTPDYQLPVDQSIISLSKNNDDILDIYIASMTKWVLENKSDAKSKDNIKLNSFIILLNYCADPGNMVKINKNLQRAIDAKNDGILKEYLSL